MPTELDTFEMRSRVHMKTVLHKLFERAPGISGGARTILLVIIAALSLIANIIQIGERASIWVIIGIGILLLILVYALVRPILQRNPRGAWLFNAIGATGLVDVENRAVPGHRLPPERIFASSDIRFILITGVLDQLFQKHRDDVMHFVRRGGEARVLLTHPERVKDSLRSTWTRHDETWMTYWITNCNEAQVAVDGILDSGLDREHGFEVRFMCELPPILGILALDAKALAQAGRKSFVRIQPLTVSKWIGRGVVLIFEKLAGSRPTPFDYFAEDLLEQWRVAAADEPYLIRRRQDLGISR
jgi:hypothetical protein